MGGLTIWSSSGWCCLRFSREGLPDLVAGVLVASMTSSPAMSLSMNLPVSLSNWHGLYLNGSYQPEVGVEAWQWGWMGK